MFTTDNPAASPDTLLTQQQIAEVFGVSKRRVQQIEDRALEKLRDAAIGDPYLREWVLENVWLPEFYEARKASRQEHREQQGQQEPAGCKG